jgi:hypothetical protein
MVILLAGLAQRVRRVRCEGCAGQPVDQGQLEAFDAAQVGRPEPVSRRARDRRDSQTFTRVGALAEAIPKLEPTPFDAKLAAAGRDYD